MDLYLETKDPASLGRAMTVNGVFWSTLGLVVVLLSLAGLPKMRGKLRIQLVFWISLLLAYGVALGMRIALLFTDIETNNSGTRLGFNILFAIEISLFQLAAATVVLILQRLSVVCDPTYSPPGWKDKMWLLYSALQLPMNVGLSLIRYATNQTSTFWWSPINIFLAQCITLVVFFHYRRSIGTVARTASLSTRTHDLLEYTLERFAEVCGPGQARLVAVALFVAAWFIVVYVFYAIVGMCGMIASILDIAGEVGDTSWGGFAFIYVLCEPAAAFYLTLTAMYIFRPRWYDWMRSVKIGGTFIEPVGLGSAPLAAPSAMHIVSGTTASAQTQNSNSRQDSVSTIVVDGSSAGPRGLGSRSLDKVTEETLGSDRSRDGRRSANTAFIHFSGSEKTTSSGTNGGDEGLRSRDSSSKSTVSAESPLPPGAKTVTRNSSSKKKVTIASPSNEFEDV